MDASLTLKPVPTTDAKVFDPIRNRVLVEHVMKQGEEKEEVGSTGLIETDSINSLGQLVFESEIGQRFDRRK